MRQIFISYAREDRPFAERLAKAFETLGWSVWWDRTIPAGRSFDEVIDTALREAKCVVVLWSAASSKSQWVMAEAQDGADRDILIPVQIQEAVRTPLGFRRLQSASLVGWTGSLHDPEFTRLAHDVSQLMGTPSPVESPPEKPGPAPAPHIPQVDIQAQAAHGGSRSNGILIGVVVAVVVLALAAFFILGSDRGDEESLVTIPNSSTVTPPLSDAAPASAADTAVPGTARASISEATYLDEASDFVGVWGNDGPNGRQDSHFRLVLVVDGEAQEVAGIQVRLTDATGRAGGGNIWRTSQGDAWMVGVRHGLQWLTPGYVTTLGRFPTGPSTLDVYVDGGAVKSGEFYAIDVAMADGRVLTRLLSTP